MTVNLVASLFTGSLLSWFIDGKFRYLIEQDGFSWVQEKGEGALGCSLDINANEW